MEITMSKHGEEFGMFILFHPDIDQMDGDKHMENFFNALEGNKIFHINTLPDILDCFKTAHEFKERLTA